MRLIWKLADALGSDPFVLVSGFVADALMGRDRGLAPLSQ